jgi:iron complex outermembrane receptor protein
VNENFEQAALRLDAQVTPTLKLTSITSISHFDMNDLRDTDGSTLNVFAVAQRARSTASRRNCVPRAIC